MLKICSCAISLRFACASALKMRDPRANWARNESTAPPGARRTPTKRLASRQSGDGPGQQEATASVIPFRSKSSEWMSLPDALAAVAFSMYWLAALKFASTGCRQYPELKKIVVEYSSSEKSSWFPRQESVGWKFSYWISFVTN